MNRKSIAYLKALGIDVWLPRSTQSLERPESPQKTNVLHVTASSELQQNTNHARLKSGIATPRESSKSIAKQSSSARLTVYVEQIGEVAIVYAEPIPTTVRVAKDIAFFFNGYERKQAIVEDWNWPPFGLAHEETLTETTKKGFVVWLGERVQRKRLLFVCRDVTVDQLVKDVECEGHTIDLDVQRLKRDGKRKLWDQLESQMT